MLRGENIACGTSTTGTGTLTLAATPAAIGALDFVQWLGTSGVHLIPYKIVEYADNTYAKPTKVEVGIGTLTLAAAITSATLARTTVMVTQSGTTYTDQGASAINIGTAANVLVFMGPSAADTPMPLAYFNTTGSDGIGVAVEDGGEGTSSYSIVASGTALFWAFKWPWSLPLSQAATRIQASATGAGTLSFAVFEIGTDGKPGRRLINFGNLGDPSQGGGTILQNSALGTPIRLPPGYYYGGLLGTGYSVAAAIRNNGTIGAAAMGIMGTSGAAVFDQATVASGNLNDPPTTTGWTLARIGDTPQILMK